MLFQKHLTSPRHSKALLYPISRMHEQTRDTVVNSSKVLRNKCTSCTSISCIEKAWIISFLSATVNRQRQDCHLQNHCLVEVQRHSDFFDWKMMSTAASFPVVKDIKCDWFHFERTFVCAGCHVCVIIVSKCHMRFCEPCKLAFTSNESATNNQNNLYWKHYV